MYNIYFQEIWDFNLTFQDWKCTDLLIDKNKPFDTNPQLELILQT